MKVYECNHCLYSTNDPANWKKHCATKKHKLINSQIEKEEAKVEIRKEKISEKTSKKYECDICNKIYTSRQGLYKHNTKCLPENKNKKNHDYEKECYLLKLELEKAKTKIKELSMNEKIYDEKAKHLDEKVELYKTSLDDTKQILIKSMDCYTSLLVYLNKHETNTPALTYDTEINKIFNDKNKLIDCLYIYHKNDKLVSHIGNIIKSHYLKDEKQSLYSSDTNRFTYVISVLLDEKTRWIVDKKGINTSKIIIKPLIDELNNFVIEELSRFHQLDPENQVKQMQRFLALCSLNKEFENGVFEEKLKKYITPYFHFDKSKLIQSGENGESIESVDDIESIDDIDT